jgi:hypothetical protein
MRPVDAWPRPRHARTDAVAQVDVFCFSPGPLGDAPMPALKDGLPGQPAMEDLDAVDVPGQPWVQAGALPGTEAP